MANKDNECLVDEIMDVVDPEKVLANRRKYIKDAMKPAEKARDELEKATATEKVRLQGTKETKAPSLKPYTESFDVKNRQELGKLICGAKRDNRTWSVERCSDDKLKEGYRYTFYTTKLQEAFTESKPTKILREEDEEELPVGADEFVEIELGDDEVPAVAVEETDADKAVAILKRLFNFHGGDKPNSFVICLMDGDKEEQCIEIPEVSEDDLNTLHAVFFEPEEMGKEPEAEVEVEEIPEEDAVVLDLGEGLKEEKEEEPKLETFEEQMDFLAADEQEAINGYEKVLGLIEDEHVKEQLQHIMEEEIAHKDFLEKVKEDRSLVYSHEDAEEEIIDDEEELVSLELPPVELEAPVEAPVEESLSEASSAEKKAFRHGGEDQQDLEFGRALARIKDPHERAMLLNQKRMEKAGKKMSDRPETNATLQRHLDNAEKAFIKKQKSMAKAGMEDRDGYNNDGKFSSELDESAKISLDDLRMFNPWGGAKDVWELLVAQEKLDDLDKALEDMYPDGITTSELNDILWFERDWVLEKTGADPFLKQDDAIEVEAEVVEPEESEEE